jgi:hypothetical protein
MALGGFGGPVEGLFDTTSTSRSFGGIFPDGRPNYLPYLYWAGGIGCDAVFRRGRSRQRKNACYNTFSTLEAGPETEGWMLTCF